MDQPPFQPDDWRVGVSVSVERAGHAILGKVRLELLESIDRCRSISAAARELGISYRHAWKLVQSMNDGAGMPLVASVVGGVSGGGAALTPLGRRAIAVFRELQDRLGHAASALMPRLTEQATATLHVLAAVSLEDVLGQLLADFGGERPDLQVRVVYGASDELADHLLTGALADLFLTADSRQLDRLAEAHLLDPAGRAHLASNGLAAIGSENWAKTIRKPADLVRAADLRIALAVPECPLGGYTRAYLEKLGLYQCLRGRAVLVENSRSVLAAVRGRRADVGFIYTSDAARLADCRILFVARRLPTPIHYAAAVLHATANSTNALALLAFLTTAKAAHRFRACGFGPLRNSNRRELSGSHG